jgi:hypothetical protein
MKLTKDRENEEWPASQRAASHFSCRNAAGRH